MNPAIRICGIGSVLSLGIGIVLSGSIVWLIPLSGAIALLYLGIWRSRSWAISAWFAVQVALAALSGPDSVFPLMGVVLALGAWDLVSFRQRLTQARHVHRKSELVARHARLLLATLLAGWMLSLLAVASQIRLSFAAATIAALLAAIGLNTLLGKSRSASADYPPGNS